jgi:Cys-tRNA(Pro) deacylase
MSRLDAGYLREYIEAMELSAKVIEVDVPTPTVEAAAQAVATSPKRILKSLLFLIDGKPILVIASGIQPVDRRTLSKHFNVGKRRVKLADAKTVEKITGYGVGGVPPIGHSSSLTTVLDEQVLNFDRVYGGGGGIDVLLEIDPQEIVQCTGATAINLREG